jgi:hypothetical protein
MLLACGGAVVQWGRRMENSIDEADSVAPPPLSPLFLPHLPILSHHVQSPLARPPPSPKNLSQQLDVTNGANYLNGID